MFAEWSEPAVQATSRAPFARGTGAFNIANMSAATRANLDAGLQAAKAASAPTSALDKAKAWWTGQSTGAKVGMGAGVVAVLGGIVYLVAFSGPPAAPYKANRRSRRRRSRRSRQ